jgi:hypothetical protein
MGEKPGETSGAVAVTAVEMVSRKIKILGGNCPIPQLGILSYVPPKRCALTS